MPQTEDEALRVALSIDGEVEHRFTLLVGDDVARTETSVVLVEHTDEVVLVADDRVTQHHLSTYLHATLLVLVEGPVRRFTALDDSKNQRINKSFIVLQIQHFIVGADVDILRDCNVECYSLFWVE